MQRFYFYFPVAVIYYMVASCCDKFNIVFDSECHVLGYPDGGYAGKGDGKMANFHNEATDETVFWKRR